MVRPARTAVLLACIWLLYQDNVRATLAVLSIYSFFGTLLSRQQWLRVCLACQCAAWAWLWVADQDWFATFHRGPNAFLYAASALAVVHVAFEAARSAHHRTLTMHAVIYRARKSFYVLVVNACFIVSIYYVSVVSEFVDDDPALAVRQTTQWVNKTSCEHRQKQNSDDSLYDAYEFTPECAYYVWVRNRINMLALLQVFIAFHVVVRMPYEQAEYKVGLLYIVLSILQCVLLFAGVTVWLDTVQAWYEMELFTAVCLSCYVCLQSYSEVIKRRARVFRGMPTHWQPYGTQTQCSWR